MYPSQFKVVSTFSAIGLAFLILAGYALGIYTNPISQSLENQDLRRDLSNTQQNLDDKNQEVEVKKDLVEEFYKEYQKAK